VARGRRGIHAASIASARGAGYTPAMHPTRSQPADGAAVAAHPAAAPGPADRRADESADESADAAADETADRAGLAARLARSQAELQALRAEFEQFTYAVSHDLRAPLRAIDNFAGLLERRLGDGLEPAARDHLDRIRGASARLGSLIDALLLLSRAGRHALQPQPVDLSLLAEWALAELQEAEPGRAVAAVVQPGLVAHGDEALLRQLLQQLLHNAWKFSAGCDRVALEVAGETAGGRLLLRVRDQGSGFDMRYADKLFAPFQRLHGPEEGGGHGIGLAIAARIAARHGGTIRAEGAPGAGATFHVDLPATASAFREAAAAAPAPPAPPPPGPPAADTSSPKP
jgi:signal transduction histidine kinase